MENQRYNEDDKMPLRGLAIGDGLCDPVNQLDYADFLFQTGLVDENDRDTVREVAQKCVDAINTKEWHKASEVTIVEGRILLPYVVRFRQQLRGGQTLLLKHHNPRFLL